MANDPIADPFGEHQRLRYVRSFHALGARFNFSSDNRTLLSLASAAFGNLPRHRLLPRTPACSIALRLVPHAALGRRSAPPPLRTYAGNGLVCGVVNGGNHVVISPDQRAALVVISTDMLEFPYHARYELIEFAVYVLATRALQLLPVHAACVGRRGRGVLLVGDSGAGKSTLALHAMLNGLTLLAEDCVFLAPGSMLATAAPNFLHLRKDSMRWIDDAEQRTAIDKSPTIRRRSGVLKHEVDLRAGHWPIASRPLDISDIVFLSKKQGVRGRLLQPLPRRRLKPMLLATQPYAAGLAGWSGFCALARTRTSHVLYRGHSPADSASALLSLL